MSLGWRIIFLPDCWRGSAHATPLSGCWRPALTAGVLCMADRNFYGYELWRKAQAQQSHLLWRIKKNLRLPREQDLSDGSYLSTVYPSTKARRQDVEGIRVRVIEYHLEGVPDAEPLYRLLTTLLDDTEAPAAELAALYHERWEIETALDEFKTHLKGPSLRLRSNTRPGAPGVPWLVAGLLHRALADPRGRTGGGCRST